MVYLTGDDVGCEPVSSHLIFSGRGGGERRC